MLRSGLSVAITARSTAMSAAGPETTIAPRSSRNRSSRTPRLRSGRRVRRCLRGCTRWRSAASRTRLAERRRRAPRCPPADSREYGPDVAAALSRALLHLPEAQREVAVLKLVRGARFAEIGEMLGVSEGAAKMRFVRALEALRLELEQEGVAP